MLRCKGYSITQIKHRGNFTALAAQIVTRQTCSHVYCVLIYRPATTLKALICEVNNIAALVRNLLGKHSSWHSFGCYFDTYHPLKYCSWAPPTGNQHSPSSILLLQHNLPHHSLNCRNRQSPKCYPAFKLSRTQYNRASIRAVLSRRPILQPTGTRGYSANVPVPNNTRHTLKASGFNFVVDGCIPDYSTLESHVWYILR